jgi:ribosomal protein S17E
MFKLEKDFIKKVGEELIKEYFEETSENYYILKEELLNILSSKKY